MCVCVCVVLVVSFSVFHPSAVIVWTVVHVIIPVVATKTTP